MTLAVEAFLQSLDNSGRATATLPFDTAEPGRTRGERTNWHYTPRARAGLSFRDMDAAQQQRAYLLAAAGLSLPAFAAVTTIIGLEDVLDRVEGGARGRHRADYHVTVFGRPGAATWGWRFEGHHVSLNVTLVDDEIAATPLFLGANPASVLAASGAVVVRPLAAEDDLASELFDALNATQRDAALLSTEAPADLLTTNAPTLDEMPDAEGVRFAELQGSARTTAQVLVRHYLDRLPAEESDAWWRLLAPDIGDLRFAVAGRWGGPRTAGDRRPQYYRLAGPSFFVEYDNTQNDANHVHSVLRNPGGDFGLDLLREHLAAHH